MRRRRKSRTIAIAVAALAANLSLAALAAGTPLTPVSRKVELLLNHRTLTDRPSLAVAMAHDVAALRDLGQINSVGHKLTLRITKLLDDDNDVVRSQAAAALGIIGPRARAAIPNLKRALLRIRAEHESKGPSFVSGPDSEDAIELALNRIGGSDKAEKVQ
jgi:HEAT repeat protein